jgi:hypothetical protein
MDGAIMGMKDYLRLNQEFAATQEDYRCLTGDPWHLLLHADRRPGFPPLPDSSVDQTAAAVEAGPAVLGLASRRDPQRASLPR